MICGVNNSFTVLHCAKNCDSITLLLYQEHAMQAITHSGEILPYNKEFVCVCVCVCVCITHTVEHNYISPSSTVGIQLHVSALYVRHRKVVYLTEQLYKMCTVFF